ncbi:MAG: Chemotaxis protein methyltransferase CheR, partial [Chloroflexi bacterium]|nr:Chemotaxis protein methyltransferase CheR [Chloroflexota bacterium]
VDHNQAPPPSVGSGDVGPTLLIADVTALTGVAPPRLRSWENAGLLRPRRLPNAVRVYGVEDVARARLIKRSLVRPGRRDSLRRLAAALARGEVQPSPQDYDGLDSRPRGDLAWRALIDAMPDLVVACDIDGKLITMNPALRALLCPESLDEPDEPLPAALENLTVLWTARTGTLHVDLALTLRDQNDTAVPTLWNVAPLRMDSGVPYGALGVGRPVAANPPAQEDWLAIAAHDLRTPVTVIFGWGQLARDASIALRSAGHSATAWTAAVDQLNGYLTRLEVSTIDLIRHMDTILDATSAASGSLLQNLAPSGVEFDTLVREAVAHAQAHTSRHTVTLEAPSGSFPVTGDRVRLRELLDNLLANSIKYAPDGGPITLCLARAHTPVASAADASMDAEGHAGDAPQWITLRVRDSGMGIPAEAVPRVFERFWRAQGPTRHMAGSGLGLYVCRAIAIAHGGHIWVEQSVPAMDSGTETPGWHGTVIVLTLPLAGSNGLDGTQEALPSSAT